jgi:hypothetical protein
MTDKDRIKGAGRELYGRGEEAFGACEGICVLAGQIGDVGGAEGYFAGLGLCHFDEFEA